MSSISAYINELSGGAGMSILRSQNPLSGLPIRTLPRRNRSSGRRLSAMVLSTVRTRNALSPRCVVNLLLLLPPIRILIRIPISGAGITRTAAVLNFRHILFNLREGKGTPERFQREIIVSPANQSTKPIKRLKKSTKKPKTQIQKHSG
ncbi:hypothetical protein H4R24_004054 [Coemansia sp. RSA 988]|nr:hypothetical protein H4R24_004054 [Coemansia sp. RSA 988]